MSSSEQCLRHAATCRRLADRHGDESWSARLLLLAERYEASAAELEALAVSRRSASMQSRETTHLPPFRRSTSS